MPSVHESQENEAVVVMLHETIQSWSLPDKAKSSLSCQNIDRVKHLFSTDKRMDIPSLDKRRFCGHCMIFQNILRRHCSQEDNLILKDFCRSFSCQEPRLFLVEFSIMLCVESLSLKCSFAPLLCSFFLTLPFCYCAVDKGLLVCWTETRKNMNEMSYTKHLYKTACIGRALQNAIKNPLESI